MDVVRKNTDYAFRLLLELADSYGSDAVSTKKAAELQLVPYQLACKLMQKLHKAHLLESVQGAMGGFRLNKVPAEITMADVIEAIQGPILLSRCVLGDGFCQLKKNCPINKRLAELQNNLDSYFGSVTLADLKDTHKAAELKSKKTKKR